MASEEAIRILRVIARMNVGGPAYHVSLLSGRLAPDRYQTLLVAGTVGAGEASSTSLAQRYGARLRILPSLGPEIRPLADARSLVALMRIIRRYRPRIVHTHTAKAGMLGRSAALLAGHPRPVIVHTYHGHVLEGYFGPVKTWAYRVIERMLARRTDVLIGVSDRVVDDLVRLGVAPRERFRTVPLGLELERFATAPPGAGGRFREEVGVAPEEVLAVSVGRLVPIKRIDVMLRAVARARERGAPVRLAIVGDGELRGELERLASELGLDGAVSFLGYRSDLVEIAAASDLALLTSDNEGTPVALIEAAAAGRPAVATSVGGVSDVVVEGSGLLAAADDVPALAGALHELAGDPARRAAMGARARDNALRRFAADRLLTDIDSLYRELLVGV